MDLTPVDKLKAELLQSLTPAVRSHFGAVWAEMEGLLGRAAFQGVDEKLRPYVAVHALPVALGLEPGAALELVAAAWAGAGERGGPEPAPGTSRVAALVAVLKAARGMGLVGDLDALLTPTGQARLAGLNAEALLLGDPGPAWPPPGLAGPGPADGDGEEEDGVDWGGGLGAGAGVWGCGAVGHASAGVRMDALELACVSSRVSDAPGRLELAVAGRWLAACVRSTALGSRNKCLVLVTKLVARAEHPVVRCVGLGRTPNCPELLSPNTVALLLAGAVDSWDKLRQAASSCLMRLPTPLPGLASGAALGPLLGWAVGLLGSPRMRESDAGARLIKILYAKYVAQHRWRLELAPVPRALPPPPAAPPSGAAAAAGGAAASAASASGAAASSAAAVLGFLQGLVDAVEAAVAAGRADLLGACRRSLAHGPLLLLLAGRGGPGAGGGAGPGGGEVAAWAARALGAAEDVVELALPVLSRPQERNVGAEEVDASALGAMSGAGAGGEEGGEEGGEGEDALGPESQVIQTACLGLAEGIWRRVSVPAPSPRAAAATVAAAAAVITAAAAPERVAEAFERTEQTIEQWRLNTVVEEDEEAEEEDGEAPEDHTFLTGVGIAERRRRGSAQAPGEDEAGEEVEGEEGDEAGSERPPSEPAPVAPSAESTPLWESITDPTERLAVALGLDPRSLPMHSGALTSDSAGAIAALRFALAHPLVEADDGLAPPPRYTAATTAAVLKRRQRRPAPSARLAPLPSAAPSGSTLRSGSGTGPNAVKMQTAEGLLESMKGKLAALEAALAAQLAAAPAPPSPGAVKAAAEKSRGSELPDDVIDAIERESKSEEEAEAQLYAEAKPMDPTQGLVLLADHILAEDGPPAGGANRGPGSGQARREGQGRPRRAGA
ncbi:hypothetical protein HYH03_018603 [Edaphochlamys debaryana]|uniref:Uncharacterized protein n=1 Tax=Edaphochlamys debaryana TaxID=47281 RepID=A0A836BP78_9CHLO|nr:hypothetical protein HYH03_018603 [Edaphochlamys debaryana]|eukprot:KAG2482469.1 hypothetical protein HYH03_018603 [Edaphochlamys debaryana]